MRKLLIFSACVFLLASCSKSSDNNGGGSGIDYSGSYTGTITVTTNGSVTQTLSAYTIVVAQAGNTITLTNNVNTANSGTLSNGVLTLDKKFVAFSPSTNLEDYGTATLSSTAMVINFKQDERNFTTNAVVNTKVWTGTLIKQ